MRDAVAQAGLCKPNELERGIPVLGGILSQRRIWVGIGWGNGVDGLALCQPLLDVVGAVRGGKWRLDGVGEGDGERGDVAEVGLGGEDLDGIGQQYVGD